VQVRTPSRTWLAAAVTLSGALVVAAPYIGQVRAGLRMALGDAFVPAMAGLVLGAVGLATLMTVRRIRDRRPARYAALGAAIGIGVLYALGARTGNAEVDAVERFHFVEYGLIAALFYRAWRPAGDGSLLVMPAVAGLMVGTLEEWLQWFVPARIGEVRDVLLNGVAIACGMLFSLALDPPSRLAWTMDGRSRRHAACLGASALVAFGVFVDAAHLGHEIADSEAGVFRSRYSAGELADVARDRARRWRDRPPLTWVRLSREDQYLSEGEAHVRRRNDAWSRGDVRSALHEDRILERYYAPVLDSPSYLSATGHRWSRAQRADAESRAGSAAAPYVSDAIPYPILVWPRWVFWSVILALAALVLRAGRGGA
jgi:hypothetical protein